MKRLVLLSFMFIIFSLSISCALSGEPVANVSDYRSGIRVGIRQTDDNGHRLPFTTKFPKRWNSGNSGTSYEPCTAVTPDVLRTHDIDPTTVEDAASVDYQTARGCGWKYFEPDQSSITQQVGGPERSLDEYKRKKAGIIDWLPDVEIAGRRVIVGTLDGSSECGADVWSESTSVVTSVQAFDDHTSLQAICQRAIDFTRATIDKIPR